MLVGLASRASSSERVQGLLYRLQKPRAYGNTAERDASSLPAQQRRSKTVHARRHEVRHLHRSISRACYGCLGQPAPDARPRRNQTVDQQPGQLDPHDVYCIAICSVRQLDRAAIHLGSPNPAPAVVHECWAGVLRRRHDSRWLPSLLPAAFNCPPSACAAAASSRPRGPGFPTSNRPLLARSPPPERRHT